MPDDEKHAAYCAGKAVDQQFYAACRKAGIDHRNVPKALAELAEREAMTDQSRAAQEALLLARYVHAMREWEKAETGEEQQLALVTAQALWSQLAKARNEKLLGV